MNIQLKGHQAEEVEGGAINQPRTGGEAVGVLQNLFAAAIGVDQPLQESRKVWVLLTDSLFYGCNSCFLFSDNVSMQKMTTCMR